MSEISDILVVGSGGYIGQNSPYDFTPIDLKDGNDFLDLEPYAVNVIIFLAARLESTQGAYLYNYLLYKKLDEWLEEFPYTHVIYTSSAAVYGEGDLPHKENEYFVPLNLYGESKLAGEYHVREYKNHTVLRLGNVFGGDGGHGVTEAFQRGERKIFGSGEQIRDFVPVSKVWQVINAAIHAPDVWQGVFNVSLGRPTTINDWFEKHGDGVPEHVSTRAGDIDVSMLDNSKMVRALAEGERDRE